MNAQLYVTACFLVKPGRTDEVLSLLGDLVIKTKLESGCEEYGYYQSLADPQMFTSIEVWKDAESEAAHWEMSPMKNVLIKVADLIQGGATVTKFTKVL